MQLDRSRIIAALISALEPLPCVYALWEGGSAAFGRLDQYSDLDLMADADHEQHAYVLSTVEQVLAELSPIELRFQLPEPTWHGHTQVFLQLRDTAPWLMIDFVVMKHSQGMRFNEVEQHGHPVVYFDKCGVVTETCLDADVLQAQVRGRIEQLRITFPLFQPLVSKELLRGRALDALSFYHSLILRPLVEMLRLRYCPQRWSFGMRYLYFDLPAAVVAQLEPLAYVSSPEELPDTLQAAAALFQATLAELDADPPLASA